ncbi:MAG: hypothetical protein OXL41_07110, partial [Nitrospinae bacterium]|nr:hypothetical protein [Nitrospinota bacterium]
KWIPSNPLSSVGSDTGMTAVINSERGEVFQQPHRGRTVVEQKALSQPFQEVEHGIIREAARSPAARSRGAAAGEAGTPAAIS